MAPASISTEDIKILSSTSRSLTLEFTPLNWNVDSLIVGGELYQRLSFDGSEFRSRVGEPLIPARVAVIGIPLSHGQSLPIHYQILESVYQEIPSIRLLPGPEAKVEDGFAWEIYSPDTRIYSSSEAYPGKVVEVEPPGYFRDQRIVRMVFFPLQYFPQNKVARRYDRLVIKIDFIEAPDAPAPANSAGATRNSSPATAPRPAGLP
ncbi:MAG: hypothetical protein ONB05_07300 [candidate division KSB1 bacterium]|nr:hypothetical protein [candidate division KSB1 bacterium]